jgi:hypothetical protein
LTPSKCQDTYAKEEIDKQEMKGIIKRKVAEISKRIGEERGYHMDKPVQEEKEWEEVQE